MALYKTKGIVLKSINLGEADKIITIYSDASGRISAVAKGARKTKSKFGARLEPFSYLHLLLYKGRNLDIITQAEIIHSFQKIREDLDKFSYGAAILELVNKISLEGEKNELLFSLLLTALKTLEELKENTSLLLTAFQLKFLAISGYLPELIRCVCCGQSLSSERKVKFSIIRGGVLCAACHQADPAAYFISPNTPNLLGQLLRADRSRLNKITVAPEMGKELSVIMENYLNYHLETRLKSRNFLSKIE